MFSIVVTDKAGAQRRHDVDGGEATIGRVQGNDVILPKGNVSKRHARIVRKDGRLILVDLKSTNGTYVNGRKITSPLVLKTSDKIYIGDFILAVDGDDLSIADPIPSSELALVASMVGDERTSERAVSAPTSFPPLPPSSPMPPAPPSGVAEARRGPQAAPPPLPLPPLPPSQPIPPPLPSVRPIMPAAEPPTRAVAEPPTVHRPSRATTIHAEQLARVRAALGSTLDLRSTQECDAATASRALEAARRTVAAMISNGELEASVDREALAAAAAREAIGLGALDALLDDARIREIVVLGPHRVLVDLGGGLDSVGVTFSGEEALSVIAARLAARGGSTLDAAHPIAEAVLRDGTRFTAALPPVAPRGPMIELRRTSKARTIDELVIVSMLSVETRAILAAAVAERRTIAVVGPSGAGVTSVLGALALLVPPTERLLVIEDVPDLVLARERLIELRATEQVPFAELLRRASHLHADRLIVDDLRGAEVADALRLAQTRNRGSLLGVHTTPATSSREALAFLAQLGGLSDANARMLIDRTIDVLVRLDFTSHGRPFADIER